MSINPITQRPMFVRELSENESYINSNNINRIEKISNNKWGVETKGALGSFEEHYVNDLEAKKLISYLA